MNPRKSALVDSKHKYEVRQSSETPSIRRNLLFVSLLSFASLAVSPKDGVYSINLGVISGSIDNPELVFLGLLIVCFYQLYHFYINAEQAIFNSVNFIELSKIYMYELSAKVAFLKWNELAKKYQDKGFNTAVGNFIRFPGDNHKDQFIVYAKTQKEHLDSEPSFVQDIASANNFELVESRGFYEIRFTYQPTEKDYSYLAQHRSQFLLTKQKDILEYAVPCVVSLLAMFALGYRAYSLHFSGG